MPDQRWSVATPVPVNSGPGSLPIAAEPPIRRLGTLGFLPILSVVTASGLLVVANANSLARQEHEAAPLLFWLGLLVMFVPSAIRLASATASRNERVGIVLLNGIGLYIVKVLHDPLMFTFFDEFLHVRTAQDIIESGRLFTENTLLLASAYFPGLENATTAISTMSDSSLYVAGTLLLGAARLLFILVLFLFYEMASSSARVAGIATLVYSANPSFIFFSAQFAYESFALPLAMMVLLVILRRTRSLDGTTASWALIAVMVAGAVVTHHVSSLALTAFLVLWSAVHLIRRPQQAIGPFKPAVLTLAATMGWILMVATVTIGYLAPAIEGAAADIRRLAAGESGVRQLFRVSGAPAQPAWEIAVGYGAVAIILVALPVGLWHIRKRFRLDSITITLALASLAYPLALIARLTERGAELSARATTFVFVGVSFVFAAAVVRALSWRIRGQSVVALWSIVAAMLFLGGVVVAVPPWGRLPGPYLVGADPASIEPQGIAAAQWTLHHLGPENRFMTDRTNRLLLGTYGRQHPITASGDRVNVRPAFFATVLGSAEIGVLRAGRVRYVLIDRRLSAALPRVGVYTERGEANAGRRTVPIAPSVLAKFDRIPGVSRIFDSGDLQIYDIGVLTDE